VRLGLKPFAVFVALMLAVVGGGFLNAAVGPVGVAAYGVIAFTLILVVVLRATRAR
jgi:hypothetical protein